MAHITGGKVVFGFSDSLKIFNMDDQTMTCSVTCTGLVNMAVATNKIYTLRSIDNKKLVKQFFADLTESCDLFTVPAGISLMSATDDDYLVFANNDTKTLTLFDLAGKSHLELHLPKEITIKAVFAIGDGTVLVSGGSFVSRYLIGGNRGPVWTCTGMPNVTAMCRDGLSGYIMCGNSDQCKISFLSLEGEHYMSDVNRAC